MLRDRSVNRGRRVDRLVGLLIALTLAAAVASGCEDAGPEPVAELNLTVVSPDGDEGAALVELVGPVEGVEATARGWLLTSSTADTTWVLVAAETPGALSFLVRLSGDRQLRSSRLLDVAGPDDAQRSDLSGYSLEIR